MHREAVPSLLHLADEDLSAGTPCVQVATFFNELAGRGREQAFDKSGPFVGETLAMEFSAGASVPIVGVPLFAFFAVQVGVNGHALHAFQFIHQGVGARPIPLSVPPQCVERDR